MSLIGRLISFCAGKPDFAMQRRASRLAKQQASNEAALAEQRSASAEKERAEASESKAKALSTYVEMAQKLLRNVSIAYGFVTTFAYFFVAAHFFPSGLTVGDSLLFLFVAIGYGFASVMFAFSGLVFFIPDVANRPLGQKRDAAAKPSKREQRRKLAALLLAASAILVPCIVKPLQIDLKWIYGGAAVWVATFAVGSLYACGRTWAFWKDWDGFLLAFPYWLVLGVLFPLILVQAGWPAGVFIACLAFAGAMLWMSLRTLDGIMNPGTLPGADDGATLPDPKGTKNALDERLRTLRRQKRFAGAFALLALLCPLMLDYWMLEGRLSAKVLDSLGLRNEDATVRMTGAALATTRVQQAISGVAMSICEEPDGSALVSPVTLLWDGPGVRALIALGPAAAQFDRQKRDLMPRFEVAASDIQVAHPGARRCHDAPHDLLFSTDSPKAVFPADTAQLLGDVEHAARDVYPTEASMPDGKRWRLVRVLVTGYADETKLSQNGNELLSRQRAACLAAEVVKRLQDTKLVSAAAQIVDWEGQGTRAAAKSCRPQSDGAQQIGCTTPNRHSRVRMTFECLGVDGHPSSKCALGSDADRPFTTVAPSTVSVPSAAASSSANAAALACADAERPVSLP